LDVNPYKVLLPLSKVKLTIGPPDVAALDPKTAEVARRINPGTTAATKGGATAE
jgi:hypothetical protein